MTRQAITLDVSDEDALRVLSAALSAYERGRELAAESGQDDGDDAGEWATEQLSAARVARALLEQVGAHAQNEAELEMER